MRGSIEPNAYIRYVCYMRSCYGNTYVWMIKKEKKITKQIQIAFGSSESTFKSFQQQQGGKLLHIIFRYFSCDERNTCVYWRWQMSLCCVCVCVMYSKTLSLRSCTRGFLFRGNAFPIFLFTYSLLIHPQPMYLYKLCARIECVVPSAYCITINGWKVVCVVYRIKYKCFVCLCIRSAGLHLFLNTKTTEILVVCVVLSQHSSSYPVECFA